MKVYLNGLALEREAEGSAEVGQVLNELQTEIREGGKVLLTAAIDGVQIENGFRRRRQLATPVSNIERLDLTIQNSEVVAEQILQDSLQVLQQVQQEAAPLATGFRIGNEYDSNQRLADMMERLKLALQGASLVLSRSNTSANSFAQLNQAGHRLMPVVDRILTAQASGNYVAIADELEYEMPQVLRENFLVFQKLARSVEFAAFQKNGAGN
ncbi:MAG: hypothetical protein H6506_04355 [Calditrichaeota bacterium]|nr:hypothetical protein [Calditrichota bacterium]MCB9366009.1 hypothetical protein [Calditrichota bacterium]MCB9391865.1 hypothetical protein [Calditrichota bacterium]